MAYFEKEFLHFFASLEDNNNKIWFDEHRNTYEKYVKEPFKVLVGDLISRISVLDSSIKLEPKDCIFRINRDVRFSKDKIPYKTNVSASIAPGGKKDMVTPGVYIELSARDLRFYSGVYMPDKNQLLRIRTSINNNLEEFQSIIKNPTFVKTFGKLHGDANKIIPKEFKECFEKEPLIANKQFYFFKKHAPETVLNEHLVDVFMQDYEVAKPLMVFLKDALEE